MQEGLDKETTEHATRQYLGGVWGNELRRNARIQVEFGSVPIEPCGDDCLAPRRARGACKNHYQVQYERWKRKQRAE